MPVTKSAKKQVLVGQKKRLRNRSLRSECRTQVVKAGRLISSGESDAAMEAVVAAVSTLDKAAAKGVIHSSNAARRKARLVKKLNRATGG